MHLLERDGSLDVRVTEEAYHLVEHQSVCNSGVLHSGFNYPPGSLKARFATQGTSRMKAYCREHGIPIEEFGVVVVATDDREVERLRALDERAGENGVETAVIDGGELREREPHACGVAALYCPEATSVHSQQYVYALAREVGRLGATFHLDHEVESIAETADGHRIETPNAGSSAGR